MDGAGCKRSGFFAAHANLVHFAVLEQCIRLLFALRLSQNREDKSIGQWYWSILSH
jgi:hypothetical protein